MTLDEALKYIKDLVDEHNHLELGDTPTLVNILKKASNFELSNIQIKEYSFEKKFESFEHKQSFYLISFAYYSNTIEDFEFQKFKTEEEILSLLAQKELETAIEFLEEFINLQDTYTTFKRKPNFLDWLDEHWASNFELSEIKIIEEFFELFEYKYSTYQYCRNSYIENRGVFYQVCISGWQQGGYKLDDCVLSRFNDEQECKKAILDTHLEQNSLFNSSNTNTSASDVIRNLAKCSPEILVQQLMEIFRYLPIETQTSLFEKLNTLEERLAEIERIEAERIEAERLEKEQIRKVQELLEKRNLNFEAERLEKEQIRKVHELLEKRNLNFESFILKMLQDEELILKKNVNQDEFVKVLLTSFIKINNTSSISSWLFNEFLRRDEVDEVFLSDQEIQERLQDLMIL